MLLHLVYSRDLCRFVDEMPNARLVWVEECGHVPHLEQPDMTASTIVDFVKNGNPAKVATTRNSSKDAPDLGSDKLFHHRQMKAYACFDSTAPV